MVSCSQVAKNALYDEVIKINNNNILVVDNLRYG
jgi:hypothetical protein